MVEVLAPFVLFPAGVYALIILPAILILYFLKKKTKTIALPSFMFLLQQQGKVRRRWFPRLPFNWLLLIHLLLGLTLAAAILEPFYYSNESQTKDEVVLIIDTSASMQANGYDAARADAITKVAETNTIIVTSPRPKVLLKQGSATQARSIIEALSVNDAPGNLIQSLELISEMQIQSAGVHIFSDFQDDEDVFSAIQRISNNEVYPHEYKQSNGNIGFVDTQVTDTNITLLIRNYNDENVTAYVDFLGNRQDLTLPANDFRKITVPYPNQRTFVSLFPQDDLVEDNMFYIAPKPTDNIKLIYVTEKQNQFTNTMLSVIPFIYTENYAPPGVIDMLTYDAFIIENVDASKLLPSNIDDMLTKVNQGGVLIIKASDSLQNLETHNAYPYKQILGKETAEIEMLPGPFTENLAAFSKELVHPIEPSDDATTLIQTTEGKTVVAYKNYGEGIIVYYGINDESPQSTFKLNYAYPILFQRLMQSTFEIPTINQIHIETGDEVLTQGIVQTPSGTMQGPVVAAYAGYHTVGKVIRATNLLDIDESNTIKESALVDYNEFFSDDKVPVSLQKYLLMLALVLLLIEFIYIKQRGDY